MRRLTPFLPFFFLIPVLLLLMGLPSQLHGTSPYHTSTFSYVASVFGWMFVFGAILIQFRRPKWGRMFWILVALNVVVSATHSLWISQNGVVYFLFELVAAYICLAIAFAVLPIRKKEKFPHQ